MKKYPATLAVILFLLSCSSDPEDSLSQFTIAYPGPSWEQASPESQGIDSVTLVSMMEELQSSSLDIDGILVVRNGRLVFQAYNAPYSPDIPHRIWSCTKSVVSTLIGIAIDEGYIRNTRVPVADLFPSRGESLAETVSRNLRLEHLLTMTTGLEAKDSYLYRWEGLASMRGSKDWVTFALSRPRIHKPGTRFDYSNQASYLLGAAVAEATERPTDEYADEKLFTPLGCRPHAWDRAPDGSVLGWGGLWLLPGDLARFAWLATRQGEWKGRRIVPAEWFEEATKPHAAAGTLQPDYGYQWWTADDGTVMALGYGGQYAIIEPRENLAVVFVSSLEERLFREPERLYRRYILPGLSAEPLQENPDSLRRLNTLASSWDRTFAEGAPIPETLKEHLGERYILERNVYGLRAVEFTLEQGTLVYREIYADRDIRYTVGNGEYALSSTNGLTYAVAARFDDSDRFEMREIGVGQAYWNLYSIRFTDAGLEMRITHSSGESRVIRGK